MVSCELPYFIDMIPKLKLVINKNCHILFKFSIIMIEAVGCDDQQFWSYFFSYLQTDHQLTYVGSLKLGLMSQVLRILEGTMDSSQLTTPGY